MGKKTTQLSTVVVKESVLVRAHTVFSAGANMITAHGYRISKQDSI